MCCDFPGSERESSHCVCATMTGSWKHERFPRLRSPAQSTDSSINPRSAGNLLPTAANFSQPPGKEGIAAGWRPTVIVLLLTKHSTSGAHPPSPRKAAGIWCNLLLRPGPIPCAAPLKKKKSSWNLAFFLFFRRDERTDSFLSGRTVIQLHHSVCETASEHCCSPGKHKKTTTKHGNSFTNAFIVINSNNTQKDVFVSSKLQHGNIYFCESLRRKRSQVCRHFRPTVYQTKYILWMKWFHLNTCHFGESDEWFQDDLLQSWHQLFPPVKPVEINHVLSLDTFKSTLKIIITVNNNWSSDPLWNWNIPFLDLWVVPKVSNDWRF